MHRPEGHRLRHDCCRAGHRRRHVLRRRTAHVRTDDAVRRPARAARAPRATRLPWTCQSKTLSCPLTYVFCVVFLSVFFFFSVIIVFVFVFFSLLLLLLLLLLLFCFCLAYMLFFSALYVTTFFLSLLLYIFFEQFAFLSKFSSFFPLFVPPQPR